MIIAHETVTLYCFDVLQELLKDHGEMILVASDTARRDRLESKSICIQRVR